MEPISYRVLVKNRVTDPAPSACRAAILLGKKTIGEVSWEPLRQTQGIMLFSMRFFAPGFRLRSTDLPLAQQQDDLVADLFEGGQVLRQPDGSCVLKDGEGFLAIAPTWDEAFRRALLLSRAAPEVIRLLRLEFGEVWALGSSLTKLGVDAFKDYGARAMVDQEGNIDLLSFDPPTPEMIEEERRDAASRAPEAPEVSTLERTQATAVQVSLPTNADLASIPGIELFKESERQVYAALRAKGKDELAAKLLAAVIAERAPAVPAPPPARREEPEAGPPSERRSLRAPDPRIPTRHLEAAARAEYDSLVARGDGEAADRLAVLSLLQALRLRGQADLAAKVEQAFAHLLG